MGQISDFFLKILGVSNHKKKSHQKVVLNAKIMNLRYVRFTKNGHFKFLPVNFRYYRTTGIKSKHFGH
jgi:hypothetical protein